MPKMSERAIEECIAELRAACRRPLDEQALAGLMACLRPQFEEILDHPDGPARWADHGQRMRDNGRHVGALADFFANHANVVVVGIDELTHAFEMVRAVCKVGAPDDMATPVDDSPAAKFLRALATMSKA